MSDSLQPVWIHRSQNMEAIALARKESLRTGRVDHQFHYASPHQGELWLAVHRAHSPSVTDRGVQQIYRDRFAATARRWTGKSVHVVGLGCGGGTKEEALLEALNAAGARVRFTPVEVSPTLALLSVAATREFCDVPEQPIVADLLRFADLPDALDAFDRETPRLFTFFGLMPNFEPHEMLPLLRGWIRPHDELLLSANLAPAVDESAESYRAAMDVVRPQYDNPPTQAWLTRVLWDWGLERLAPSYALTVEEHNGLLCFTARVEGMQLFYSYRYTPERLRSTLAAHGIRLGDGFVSPSREEGVWTAHIL